ncbi:MAG: AAA family ATPase [Candidatus Bathyarchaeia archaeon]
MKLRRFEIKRYRSIRSLELDTDDFLVLIGPNNHGKSNFFYALDLYLRSSSKITSDDFFNRETNLPIELTGTFDNLTEPEMEKLRPWTVEGKLTVRKQYSYGEDGKITTNYWALLRLPNEPWLNEDFEDYNEREAVATLPLYAYLPQTGKISRDTYAKAIKEYVSANPEQVTYQTEFRQNPAGFKQVLDGYLPELQLVPAVRDATDETKTSSNSTLLGRLVGSVIERTSQNNPSYQNVVQSLQNLKSTIEGPTQEQKMPEIRELEERIKRELLGWPVDVKIGVEPPDAKSVLAIGTRITIDDGFPTEISQKGHGLQRAMMFAFIRIWASLIGAGSGTTRSRSNIFAFEEPELFLHPQICRQTYEALKRISTVDQVFLCSHSPHFVSLEDYRSIVIIRKTDPSEGTKSFRAEEDLFPGDLKKQFHMIQFFNPDRNELFFARKVALVEGASEKAVLPLLGKRMGIYDYRVSIIDCSTKFNLILYMKVLNAFKIPHLVIHDEDPVDPELQPGGVRYDHQRLQDANHVFNENENIRSTLDSTVGSRHMVSPDLESLLNVSKSSAEKLGKPYACVEKYNDENTLIPAELQDLVRLVFS